MRSPTLTGKKMPRAFSIFFQMRWTCRCQYSLRLFGADGASTTQFSGTETYQGVEPAPLRPYSASDQAGTATGRWSNACAKPKFLTSGVLCAWFW